MILVDFEQQLLVRTQINPLLQGVQEWIPIRPQYMVRLVVALPQGIAPFVTGSL